MYKKTRILVHFSGGKDSQAALIWSAEKWGADAIEAIFCDTKWEHPCTVQHVEDITRQMGIPLIKLERAGGFQRLCKEANNFPTPLHRFCTYKLKVLPMVEYILKQDCNFIMIQGIRAGESEARARMEPECMYFREYFEPGHPNLKHKREVKKWCESHDASVLRPVFTWTAQQVIDYILEHGQQPNPLYRRGASRVGCFPCVMSRLAEIKIVAQDKPMRQRLLNLEEEVNKNDRDKYATFFKSRTIPDRYCKRFGNRIASAEEVLNYVTRHDLDPTLFDNEPEVSCMSLYHGLCE